jgi:hypothetical protein
LHTESGDLGLLHGDAVAIQASFAAGLGVELGDTVDVGINGNRQRLRLVATLPYTLSGLRVLVPLEHLTGDDLERRYLLTLEPGISMAEGMDQITAELRKTSQRPDVRIMSLEDWIREENQASNDFVGKFLLAVLGLVSVFIVIAMVNATIIATSARTVEFGVARLTGMSRMQVVCMTLVELMVVVLIGVTLGLLAAGGAIASTLLGVSHIVGESVFTTPSELIAGVSVAATIIIGAATAISATVATRRSPIAVAAIRE